MAAATKIFTGDIAPPLAVATWVLCMRTSKRGAAARVATMGVTLLACARWAFSPRKHTNTNALAALRRAASSAAAKAAADAEGLTLLLSPDRGTTGFKYVVRNTQGGKPFHAQVAAKSLGFFAEIADAALAVARYFGPDGRGSSSGADQWVECGRCGKWRLLPASVDAGALQAVCVVRVQILRAPTPSTRR